jgi:hypothetical protein
MHIRHAALIGALVLAGCETAGGSAPIQPLPRDLQTGGTVVSVNLTDAPETGVSAGFEALFERSVQTRLNTCARGSQPLTLEVTLDGFDRANPAMTWLIGDENRIAGIATLTDASGTLVGEYRIQRAFLASGLIGIALTAQAEDQMSVAFGDELCKQAFPSAATGRR